MGSIPGLGRSHGEGKGYPLQDPGLENSMDCMVHGIAKSQTLLRDFQNVCYSSTGGSEVKVSAWNAGDPGSIPGLGRSPGEGKGYPLQYPCLENSMGCVVHGVAKGRAQLSNFYLIY